MQMVYGRLAAVVCIFVLLAGCGGGGGGGGGGCDTGTSSDTSNPHDAPVADPGIDTGAKDTYSPTDVPVIDQGADDPGCTPNCKDKSCGDNGCGGTCGTCGNNEECKEGMCECIAGIEACKDVCCDKDVVCFEDQCCIPDCDGKDCGDDGCGGSCGACEEHFQCEEGTCVYQPWCGDSNCDTEHDEDCETCPNDCGCQGNDVCFLNTCCTPDCDEKDCGDDGCGDLCGICVEHYQCEDGACVYQLWCGDGTCHVSLNENCETCVPDCGCNAGEVCHQGECCTPETCSSLVKECGDWEDGCGGTAICGACQTHPNSFCDPSGQCDCTIDCNGKECGGDGCGGSCGGCGTNEECSALGQCQCVFGSAACMQICCNSNDVCFNNQCCTPECAGKECGSDGCGGSCGECDTPELCGGTGVVSICGTVQATHVSAGLSHTCALTSAGSVKCWGWNEYGQLGDGTTLSKSTPVNVSGLGSGAVAVTASYRHTCALTDAGDIKCWGRNNKGQLGDGTTLSKSTPVNVSGLISDVIAVAAGIDHTCALTDAGGVKCWGGNSFGQLGDGTTSDKSIPVSVSGLSSGIIAIAASVYETCALTDAGGVKCWGLNDHGQLGDGTTVNKSIPVNVSGLSSGVIAIVAGGFHTCAITSAGSIKCWGLNDHGQLGDGTTSDKSIPVNISGLSSGVIAIAAGQDHTCAVTSGGGAKCWGVNDHGQLGDGTLINRSIPVKVSGLDSGMVVVAAGVNHTCALNDSGGLKCWGVNDHGQLGDGTTGNKSTPVNVSGLSSGVIAISAGWSHSCALSSAGSVKCWGFNEYGQLGDGTTGNKSTPVNVLGLDSGVIAVAAGGYHTCALTDAGGIKCWGENYDGQLGDGTTLSKSTPVNVSGLSSGVIAISANGSHTCALTDAGGIKCWGENYYGQLGDGTTLTKSTPVNVSGLSSGVIAISAGGSHTCAVTSAGSVKCWGWNEYGQLGDGSTLSKSTPVNVLGLDSGMVEVAAGAVFTCAVTSQGGIRCWGINDRGQIGDGTTLNKSIPVNVSGLDSGMVGIAAGWAYVCGLTSAGSIKCWGSNSDGQLGDGTTSDKSIPVNVSAQGLNFIAIAAGMNHTCAVTSVGGAKCWGNNHSGELGDGSSWEENPIDVLGFGP